MRPSSLRRLEALEASAALSGDALRLADGRTLKVGDALAWLSEHGREAHGGSVVVGLVMPDVPADPLSQSLFEYADAVARGDAPSPAEVAEEVNR